LAGRRLPAGSYTIFVIPNADKWTLVISKKTVNGAQHILAKRTIGAPLKWP